MTIKNWLDKISVLMIFMVAIPCGLLAQPGFGEAEKFNDGWRFRLDDDKLASTVDYNDDRWRRVQLPHDWTVKQPLSPSLASATGYLPGGIGWYRKKFQVDAVKKDEKVYLYFEGVYNRSEVFVNGHSLGKRPNGYISFMYDATPYINFGGENVVAVRVDHSQDADSRWYTGSGIYRDVWIVTAKPVHIDQWGVYAYPEVYNSKGILNIQLALKNETNGLANVSILTELLDPNGKAVAKRTTKATITNRDQEDVKLTLDVKDPILWSLTDPRLYTLKTTVIQNGKEIDQTTTKTGFRTFTFDPNKGFALNGEWMKMKGVCLHHDAGVLGAEVYKEVWKRRLLTLKELGVNAIRTSHNPQATSLYELCDELGFLVMNEAFDEWEFPKRKWLEGWNVGTPGFQGAYDFFEEWGERDLADMVKRDRNHISIFAWSIGNEVDYPNDPYSHPVLDGGVESGFTQPIFGGYKKDAPDAMRLGDIAKRLVSIVKKYDTSRPVTAGLAGVAMSNETEYPSALDIAGYNYTESFYKRDHERYPDRVIYGSENRHDYGAWKAVTDNEHIFGQFLWTGIDYLGESGRWPSRGFYSGLLDFAGFVKPRGYFRQSLWSDTPMAYIGTYPVGAGANADVWSALETQQGNKNQAPSMDAWPIWNYQDGQEIRVVCYTNAAQARLELNGKVVGETKPYNQKDGIIFWDIPYAAGKLEVIGEDAQGKEISRYSIQSSKRPQAIRLLSSQNIKIDTKEGIGQIELQIVDEDGIPVILSEDEITCQLSGNLRLLGMEAGNNADMTNYTDNKHRVFHGKMIIYVQANGQPGEQASIRLTAPWLSPAQVDVQLK